jgi:hypothetical protein
MEIFSEAVGFSTVMLRSLEAVTVELEIVMVVAVKLVTIAIGIVA